MATATIGRVGVVGTAGGDVVAVADGVTEGLGGGLIVAVGEGAGVSVAVGVMVAVAVGVAAVEAVAVGVGGKSSATRPRDGAASTNSRGAPPMLQSGPALHMAAGSSMT